MSKEFKPLTDFEAQRIFEHILKNAEATLRQLLVGAVELSNAPAAPPSATIADSEQGERPPIKCPKCGAVLDPLNARVFWSRHGNLITYKCRNCGESTALPPPPSATPPSNELRASTPRQW